MRFEIGFRVEVDPEFPADGGEAPQRMPEGLPRIGAVLRVTAPDAEPWDIAVGASSWWRTANPRAIALISDRHGLVLDVVDRRVVVDVPGVIRITEDERDDLVLLVSETQLTAVGADGVVWVSARLAWDDLKVVRIDAHGIVCTGYLGDFSRDEIVIDPADGSQLSGPVLPEV